MLSESRSLYLTLTEHKILNIYLLVLWMIVRSSKLRDINVSEGFPEGLKAIEWRELDNKSTFKE